MNTAMQGHWSGETRVKPILVRAVDIQPDDAPFMKLQGLHTDLRPVISWPNRDEAWTNVANRAAHHRQGYSVESQGDGFGSTAPAIATNAGG